MRLSCADYTWPLLSHSASLDLIRAVGCEAVDIGFMSQRSHVRPELAHDDLAGTAGAVRERVESRGLSVADVFAIPATDFESLAVNNPSSSQQQRSLEFFADAVELASRLGSPGVTTLPGVLFADESFDEAVRRSADGLRRRVDMAGEAGLATSVEAHTGSLVDTPDKAGQLLELVPGLQLTLDYAHFVYAGVDQQEIDALMPHARHLQCRSGRPGGLQVSVAQDAIDWTTALAIAHRTGYSGYYALEYTWQDWLDCNRVDTVGESILLRDVLVRAHEAARSASTAD